MFIFADMNTGDVPSVDTMTEMIGGDRGVKAAMEANRSRKMNISLPHGLRSHEKCVRSSLQV
jgi:hypothetical protein